MFAQKIFRIFQNNHFVEHFRLAVFLIRYSLLAEWQSSISFLDTYLCVFWVFLTSVRVTLEFLAIYVEKPMQLRLQARLFFCLHWKNYFFVWRGALIEKLSIQSIIKFLENRDQN